VKNEPRRLYVRFSSRFFTHSALNFTSIAYAYAQIFPSLNGRNMEKKKERKRRERTIANGFFREVGHVAIKNTGWMKTIHGRYVVITVEVMDNKEENETERERRREIERDGGRL
jgi:predicted membrane protein